MKHLYSLSVLAIIFILSEIFTLYGLDLFNNPHKDVVNKEYISGPRDMGSDRKNGMYIVDNIVPKAEIVRVGDKVFNWTTHNGIDPSSISDHIDAYINDEGGILLEAIVNPDPKGLIGGVWGKISATAGDIVQVKFYTRPHPPQADYNPDYYKGWPSKGPIKANGWLQVKMDTQVPGDSGYGGFNTRLYANKLIDDLSLYPSDKIPEDTRDFELIAIAVDDNCNEEPFPKEGGEIIIRIGKGILSKPIVIDQGYYTNSKDHLQVSWSSKGSVAEYYYAIGTSPGGNDVVDWTSVDKSTQINVTNLNLLYGKTYFCSVKARNNEWQWSEIGVSDGIKVVAENLEQMEIDLKPGWNSISIYLDIGETDLLKVLEPLGNSFRSIWTYNPALGWKRHIHGMPDGFNSLSTIIPGEGYVIDMKTSAKLTITGINIPDKKIQLYPGWNLVGYNSSIPIQNALKSLPPGAAIYFYNNTIEAWQRYITDEPSYLNVFQQSILGNGYWVFALDNYLWNVSP